MAAQANHDQNDLPAEKAAPSTEKNVTEIIPPAVIPHSPGAQRGSFYMSLHNKLYQPTVFISGMHMTH